MAQAFHGNATTTRAIRKEIQEAPKEVTNYALAKRLGINILTVIKWRSRPSVVDRRSGPQNPRSKSLTTLEEAACVMFRMVTKLSLDDCLNALQDWIPHLKRTNLQRVFERHRISVLPKEEKRETETFEDYPIGYFYIDKAQVNTEEGRLYMFVAVDRTSKYAYVELNEKATRETAAQFLENLIENVPFTIHTVLTDKGSQFTNPRSPKVQKGIIERIDEETNKLVKCNAFDAICIKNNIEHRLTQPYNPWTNGQVKRMNRTIKEASVKKHYYKTHDNLKEHLRSFIDAYNFAKRLKAHKGLTVFDYINKCWLNVPDRFKTDPRHMIPVTYSIERSQNSIRNPDNVKISL